MASLEKHQGKTRPSWVVRWRDDYGNQRKRAFQKRSFATDFKINLENELRMGYFVEPSGLTLSEHLDSWIESHKRKITQNTYRSYLTPINTIKAHLGQKPLQKLSPNDIEEMHTKLSESKSKSFVVYVHRVLNLALRSAEKQRLINRNPCTFVESPSQGKSSAKIIHPDDIPKYLEAFKDHHIWIAVNLALFCGLRNSEILGLTWDDIDWNRNLISINHSIYWPSSKEYKIVPTKSKQNRIVPTTAAMLEDLKKHRDWQKENMKLYWDKYNKSNFICTRPDGSLITTRNLSKKFARGLKAANLDHVRFHDLRHTCASLMLLEGENIKNISEILGHSTIKITADTYVHIVDELKRKAVSRLDKYRLNKS